MCKPNDFEYSSKINVLDGTLGIFNGTKFVADSTDASGNSPYFGFLWARKYVQTKADLLDTGNGNFIASDIERPPYGEVIGAVNIFSGKFYPIEKYNQIQPNISDLGEIVALYHQFLPRQKLTFIEKLVDLFHS